MVALSMDLEITEFGLSSRHKITPVEQDRGCFYIAFMVGAGPPLIYNQTHGIFRGQC